MKRPRIFPATLRPFEVLAALVLAAVTVPSGLAAEDSTADDPDPRSAVADEIVVTANRQEVPAETVGSSVTVITADDIEARRQNTVADLLRTVPGLEVVQSGGSGQVTSVFLRGGNSSHTLVLVDDVRVNATTSGAFDFADLSADLIERVEVVRGPLSSLYGSEAVAGVVSITTRRGRRGVHVSARAEAGELDHQRFQVGVDGATDAFDYSLSYSDLETDGVSAAARGSEDDPHESSTLAGRMGFGFADDGRVDVTLRAFRGDVAIDGFDFTAGPVDDLNRLQERDGVTASVRVEKQWGRVRQTFLLGAHDDELSGIDADDVFSNFVIDSRSIEATAQSDLTVSDNDVLTLGASYEEREGESAGNFDEELDIASFFLQNAYDWKKKLFLTVGARYDDHSEFGGETTLRAAGAWKLGAGTRLHSSFGTGFKAPTLVDLYFPFFSNPGLEPETSRSWDFGIERRFGGDVVVVDLTYFDTDFENLIVFDFVTSLPQNIGEAESKGVEAAFDYRPGPRLRLAASYTWNDTENRSTGLPLARRPEHRGVFTLYLKPTDRFRVHAALIAVADRIDSDTSPMDDYERVDLTFQYRFSEHFEPYLRVENVFDEAYEEVNGFGSPGTQAVVGLSLRY